MLTKSLAEGSIEYEIKLKEENIKLQKYRREIMEWYKTLNIHQRINIKECFNLICGIEWDALNFMFSLKEKIEILENKLRKEEIIN